MDGLDEVEVDGHVQGHLVLLLLSLHVDLLVHLLVGRDGLSLADQRLELLRVANLVEAVESI